jgi:hypothetical protein
VSWQTADPAPLLATARSCRAASEAVRAAERAITAELGRTAVAGGWDGRAADAAGRSATRTSDRFALLAGALVDAAAAVEALAGALSRLGPELREARHRADQLRNRMLVEAAFGLSAVVKDALGHGLTELSHERTAVLRHAEELEDACRRADAGCAEQVADAARRIRRLTAGPTPYAGWLGAAVPPGSSDVLRALGLLCLDEHAARAAWALSLPDPRLRAGLATLAPVELAALLEAHPEVAQRLLTGRPPADGDPALLALLYPAYYGPRNGVPLPLRMAANRVLVAAALASRRALLAALEDEQDRLARAGHAHLLDAALADARRRIAYYDALLSEPVPNIGRRPGEPETLPGHQVLLFSDVGDGELAELWGRIDDRTRNVGILVPGTGTSITNVGMFSRDRTRSFAEHGDGSLAMITWLGGDLPDSVPLDAPRRGYAEVLGPRLRDFTAGLGLPDAVGVTVAGHSYGGAVVGVADRTGLVADRVLHIESAGAGHGVRTSVDYPYPDTARYSMTAPGDVIADVQGLEVGSTGHGADPDTLAGVIRLETGRLDDADPHSGLVQGPGSHSAVFGPRTTAWQNMYEVFTGGVVRTYVEPQLRVYPAYPAPVVVPVHPMDDPAYRPPRLDIP